MATTNTFLASVAGDRRGRPPRQSSNADGTGTDGTGTGETENLRGDNPASLGDVRTAYLRSLWSLINSQSGVEALAGRRTGGDEPEGFNHPLPPEFRPPQPGPQHPG